MRRARLAGLAAVPAAVLMVIAASPAPTALVGKGCTLGYCSHIRNDGPAGVIALRNWFCDGTTGTGSADPNCASGPLQRLPQHQDTPRAEDWDTLQIDAGWCYKVRFRLPYKTWTHRYDRRGEGPSWVKVEDHGAATVLARSTGSCP